VFGFPAFFPPLGNLLLTRSSNGPRLLKNVIILGLHKGCYCHFDVISMWTSYSYDVVAERVDCQIGRQGTQGRNLTILKMPLLSI
jgi:hypothetical protein